MRRWDTRPAMSQENVEIVRRLLEAAQRAFNAYWRDPRSIAAALQADDLPPEAREYLGHLDPEVEWKMAMVGQTPRGYLEVAKAWDDYLTWAKAYRVGLGEVRDLGDDRVYAVVDVVAEAAAGGMPMKMRLFVLYTIREGLIARMEEYTEQDQALEAAGLRE